MSLPQPFIDLVNSPSVQSFLAARDFNGMAAELNAPTERGPVPIEEVAAYCCRGGITGGVMAAIEIPIGTNGMTVQAKAMLHTVLTLIQLDYRLSTADVDDAAFGAACDGLVSMGIMTGDQKTDLLALGANRTGKAFAVLGRDCTGSECLEAAGGD